MSFSLYLGPYQPFLEEQLLQTFQAYRQKNPFEKVTVLVPNFLLVGHLRKVLTEKGQNLFNLEVHTLRHYMEAAAEEKAVMDNLKTLPDVLVPLVLKEVSRSVLAKSLVFGAVKDTPGFYHSLRSTLSELKEGLHTPESLKAHAAHFARFKEERLARKLKEFSALLIAYEDWKKKGHWLDREDIYRKVLETQEKAEGSVWIYGFYDAAELQKKVLRHLTQSANSSWFIPYEEGHPAFEYAKPFVDWAKSLGQIRGETVWKPEDTTPMKRLQNSLFQERKKPQDAATESFETSNCKILLCPGEPREAKEIARLVLQEADRRNVFLSDCGIVLREPGNYRKIMPPAFKAQEVPLSRSLPSPLLEATESKALLLLLDCFLQDFPRDGLMNLLSCPNLKPKGFSLSPEEWNPSYWDVLSREARIVEGEMEWINRLTAWRRSKERQNAEEEEALPVTEEIQAAQAFEKVLAKLFEEKARFNKLKKWPAKVNELKGVLQRLLTPSEALKQVMGVLEAFILLSESFTLTLSPEDFRSLLAAMLEEKQSPARQLEPGGAQVVDLMQARGVSFEVVVLPGLVEKSVPRLVRQDPLLLDEERKLLNGRTTETFIALKQFGALEERLLFLLAVRSAKKAVILTAPHLNPSSGSPRTPSIYLFESAEAVLGKRLSRLGEAAGLVKVVLVNDWVKKYIAECGDPLETLLTVVHQARQGQPVNALAVAQQKPFYFEGCGLLKDRQAKPLFTAYDGILAGALAQTALQKNHSLEGVSISASRLETFAACPLRYFYRYVLNVKVHPEPEKVLQLQASDRGNLMHDILEKTLEQGLREGWVPKKDLVQGLATLEKQSVEIFKWFEKEGVPGAEGLWQWEKEQMSEDLSIVLAGVLTEADWTPFAFEVAFGDEGHPVHFALKDGKTLKLQGRMDRVDISTEGKFLRVVDYKTGSAAGVKNNSVKGGTKLQLPFYLWALKNLYPDKNSREALYDFITRRGNYKKTSFDLTEAGPVEPVLDQVLSTVAQGVEAGLFPAAGKACEHCDYRKLCGTGMENRGERKKEDPQVKRYYQLEELP